MAKPGRDSKGETIAPDFRVLIAFATDANNADITNTLILVIQVFDIFSFNKYRIHSSPFYKVVYILHLIHIL